MTAVNAAKDWRLELPEASEDSAHDWLKEALVMIMTLREDDAGRWDEGGCSLRAAPHRTSRYLSRHDDRPPASNDESVLKLCASASVWRA